MQIEMTIATKCPEIPPLVSERGMGPGTPLMVDLESPCPAAIGTSPAIPIQDPPPDPLPAIPSEIRTPLHPTIDDSKAGVAVPLPARPIPSPGSQKKRSSGVITSAIIAALLDETEGSLIVIFDESHREGSLKDGSRLPFDRQGTILGHLPESADIFTGLAPTGLSRLYVGTCGADLIL